MLCYIKNNINKILIEHNIAKGVWQISGRLDLNEILQTFKNCNNGKYNIPLGLFIRC